MNKIPKPIPKLGLYPYSYAAEDIAKHVGMNDGDKTALLLEMAGAIRTGKLQVRNPQTGGPSLFTANADDLSTHVSLADVNAWLKKYDYPYHWSPHDPTTPANSGAEKRPLQRQRFQEQTLLQTIRDLGHNPTALPKRTPGKSGVKSEVRKNLKLSRSVFDKAWERLRDQNDIQESP